MSPDLRRSGLHHLLAGSPDSQAESSSSSYGLVVHLQLLPTPPHGDAVTFSYRSESDFLKKTCTSLTKHALTRTRTTVPAVIQIPRNNEEPVSHEICEVRSFSIAAFLRRTTLASQRRAEITLMTAPAFNPGGV